MCKGFLSDVHLMREALSDALKCTWGDFSHHAMKFFILSLIVWSISIWLYYLDFYSNFWYDTSPFINLYPHSHMVCNSLELLHQWTHCLLLGFSPMITWPPLGLFTNEYASSWALHQWTHSFFLGYLLMKMSSWSFVDTTWAHLDGR